MSELFKILHFWQLVINVFLVIFDEEMFYLKC